MARIAMAAGRLLSGLGVMPLHGAWRGNWQSEHRQSEHRQSEYRNDRRFGAWRNE